MPRIAGFLAVIPLVHLIVCYDYLYFFYKGFGGDISILFKAQDVLSVGIAKIAPFYISFIPMVFFNHLWMIDRPFKISGREDFFLHESLEGSKISIFWKLLFFIAPISQIIAYFSGRPMLLMGLFLPLIVLLSWIIIEFFRHNTISDKYRLPTILGFIGILQVSTGSYAAGFSARHHSYNSFYDAPSVCGKTDKLVAIVGDYFLVVTQRGIRMAVSSDCVEKLRFESRVVTADIFPI